MFGEVDPYEYVIRMTGFNIHWIPACAGMTEGGRKERGEKVSWGVPPDTI